MMYFFVGLLFAVGMYASDYRKDEPRGKRLSLSLFVVLLWPWAVICISKQWHNDLG